MQHFPQVMCARTRMRESILKKQQPIMKKIQSKQQCNEKTVILISKLLIAKKFKFHKHVYE